MRRRALILGGAALGGMLISIAGRAIGLDQWLIWSCCITLGIFVGLVTA